jgi:hypothetical protein
MDRHQMSDDRCVMLYTASMRTTLDLDEDILQVARQLAAQRGTTMGEIISTLARKALEPRRPPKTRNGVPLFAPRPGAQKPSLGLVNRLRDEA